MPDLFRHPPFGKLRAMRDRQPCVYILASGFNGTLYVGVTSNLIARVIQHRDGTFEGFTNRYDVTRLVWYEMADTMEAAIVTEKRIKRWPRDWKKNVIERDNPHWTIWRWAWGCRQSDPPRHPRRSEYAGWSACRSVDAGTRPA